MSSLDPNITVVIVIIVVLGVHCLYIVRANVCVRVCLSYTIQSIRRTHEESAHSNGAEQIRNSMLLFFIFSRPPRMPLSLLHTLQPQYHNEIDTIIYGES